MSSPRTLVWQETEIGKVYYATKVMGAEGRLYYMQEIPRGEAPVIKEEFEGTILLWKHLDNTLAKSMQSQFKAQWDADVDPENTYMIIGNRKPTGCR